MTSANRIEGALDYDTLISSRRLSAYNRTQSQAAGNCGWRMRNWRTHKHAARASGLQTARSAWQHHSDKIANRRANLRVLHNGLVAGVGFEPNVRLSRRFIGSPWCRYTMPVTCKDIAMLARPHHSQPLLSQVQHQHACVHPQARLPLVNELGNSCFKGDDLHVLARQICLSPLRRWPRAGPFRPRPRPTF